MFSSITWSGTCHTTSQRTHVSGRNLVTRGLPTPYYWIRPIYLYSTVCCACLCRRELLVTAGSMSFSSSNSRDELESGTEESEEIESDSNYVKALTLKSSMKLSIMKTNQCQCHRLWLSLWQHALPDQSTTLLFTPELNFQHSKITYSFSITPLDTVLSRRPSRNCYSYSQCIFPGELLSLSGCILLSGFYWVFS